MTAPTRAEFDVDNEHPAARFAADCALQHDVCKSLLAVADCLPQSSGPGGRPSFSQCCAVDMVCARCIFGRGRLSAHSAAL